MVAPMYPLMRLEWTRPALTVLLCALAVAALWYGAGVLFDGDPGAQTGALAE